MYEERLKGLPSSPSPSPSRSPPPYYLEHPSIQEQELYICPSPEDFANGSNISLPNSLMRRSRAGRPATVRWAPRHCANLNRRKARPKSHKKEFNLSESWLDNCVPSFIEELETDSEWDDLSRNI
ncbi:hypothetical protein RSAG8_10994, partial [Rhizoctonia solani AG-8 WAC10335]